MKMAPEKDAIFGKSIEPFMNYLGDWYSGLPAVSMESLLKEYPAGATALFCVDVVNGFCKQGNLASARVGAIVPAVVELLNRAEQLGITHVLLSQDAHPANSPEFQIYPPHCTEGSEESKTVKELTDLPQASRFRILPKRNINPGLENNLQAWLDEHREVKQFIVTGDCTDICIYQLAMHLKHRAVMTGDLANVIVPANCVDTFDISMETAKSLGIQPHPADLLHRVFLYHMHLNGIRVVAEIK